MTTSLMTDMYELTMLDAWVKDGRADDPAVFEVFARRLQPGFRYGVVAGIERVVETIENFSFDGLGLLDSGSWFRHSLDLSDETVQFLADYRFTGDLITYREGELFFPGSPIVTVRGRLADVMLETVILSILNHDCAIASKAARIVAEARGKTLIEMGSRRTHEAAAVAAARAAYVAGFDATSNLYAGRTWDVPVRGTAAHAFTLSYVTERNGRYKDEPLNNDAELAAFEAQVKAMGSGTTLLVDTFDTEQGIRNAVKAAGTSLGAVRLDSGDLAWEAARARRLLDDLGAFGTKIIVSSDLDEYVIKDLWIAGAPIDGFGVGTQLVATPPAGMVYKLVEVNGVPVAKKAKDKRSVGGEKRAFRRLDKDHKITEERLVLAGALADRDREVSWGSARDLQVNTMLEGRRTTSLLSLDEARAWHLERAVAELPQNERRVWSGDHGPFITAEVV